VTRRVRSSPAWQLPLTWRSLSSHAVLNTLLALSIAFAVTGTLIARGLSESVARSIERESTGQLYDGYAVFPRENDHTPVGIGGLSGGWVSDEDLSRAASILKVEEVIVTPGFAGMAFQVTNGASIAVPFLPGPERGDLSPDRRLSTDSDLVIPIVAPPGRGERPLYLSCGDAGIPWVRTELNIVTVDREALRSHLLSAGIIGPEIVGNVLALRGAPDRSSSVIAYNAQELLRGEFPAALVEPRRNLIDARGQSSAENLALLLSILISLPALAAIVGAVLIAGEVRTREFTLLRTLGYTPAKIRGALVREVAVVALLATAAAVAVVSIVSVLIELPLSGGRVIRVAVIGCLAPPLLAFLSARRSLEKPIAPQLTSDTAGEEP